MKKERIGQIYIKAKFTRSCISYMLSARPELAISHFEYTSVRHSRATSNSDLLEQYVCVETCKHMGSHISYDKHMISQL